LIVEKEFFWTPITLADLLDQMVDPQSAQQAGDLN
jgi:hypothetical protein